MLTKQMKPPISRRQRADALDAWQAEAHLTPAVIAAAMKRGRRARAAQAAGIARAVTGGLAGALRRAATSLARRRREWVQRGSARAGLRRLDLRLRDDIGLDPAGLREALEGTLTSPSRPMRRRIERIHGDDSREPPRRLAA